MLKFLQGKWLSRKSGKLVVNHSGQVLANVEAPIELLCLNDEDTQLFIDITISALNMYSIQPWVDRLIDQVENQTYDEMISFKSDVVGELAGLLEKEIPCFWSRWLDGLSRLPKNATFDEIDDSWSRECEVTWDECYLWLDDENDQLELPVLEFPANDEDSNNIAVLAAKLLAARPELNWNTQQKRKFGYPEPQDLFSLLSPLVNTSNEIRERLYLQMIGPSLEEAQLIEEFNARREIDISVICEKVLAHKRELLADYRRSLRPGKYGSVDAPKGSAVAEEFLRLTNLEDQLLSTRKWEAVEDILNVLRSLHEESGVRKPSADDIPVDPVEFEIWCLDVAKDADFAGHLTPGSGDQGIDVILRGHNLSVGVQCKRVAKACGNSAVQEVVSGIRHYNLDKGLVVSTAGFTRSAEQLAHSCEVDLCLAQNLKQALKDLVAKAR